MPPEPVKANRIDFEYAKDPERSPVKNGWQWADGKDETQHVNFRVPEDAPVTGALAINSSAPYGIDFILQQSCILIDRLEYSAKYVGSNAALYILVTVGFRNGTEERVWIAHKVGKSEPIPDGKSKNWVAFLPGKSMGNGWKSFTISVSDEVRQIFQSRGGQLKDIRILRLRGDLSITPIELYETGEEISLTSATES